jgi:hypothetical protein
VPSVSVRAVAGRDLSRAQRLAAAPAVAGAASQTVMPVMGLDARIVNDVGGPEVMIRWVSPMTADYEAIAVQAGLNGYKLSATGIIGAPVTPPDSPVMDAYSYNLPAPDDPWYGVPWYVSVFAGRGLATAQDAFARKENHLLGMMEMTTGMPAGFFPRRSIRAAPDYFTMTVARATLRWLLPARSVA